MGVELHLKDGIHDEKVQPKAVLPVMDDIERSSFVHIHAGVAFLSKANLCNFKTLKLQRIGPRCTGLLIHRLDDSIDILGQWDPSRVDTITTLHCQDKRAPPDMITFVYSDDTNPRRRYIKDILMGDCETTDTFFQWRCFDEV